MLGEKLSPPEEYIKPMTFPPNSHFKVHFRIKECPVKMDNFFSYLKNGLKSTYMETCV